MNVPFTTRLRAAKTPLIALALSLVALATATAFPSPLLAQEPDDTIPPALLDYVPQGHPIDETGGEILDETEIATAAAESPDLSDATRKIYLPLLENDANLYAADRLGFGLNHQGSLLEFQDVRSLNAGWYTNWSVRITPPRPYGIEFVQTVRVHQRIDSSRMYDSDTRCGESVTADRTICPYVVPHAYDYQPTRSVIERAARKNPGSIWVIGNEMERADWNGGRMDEILPQLYAVAYHDIRAIIKAADPTARIAIGGVIQFTPLRRQYLDIVWNTYKSKYGVDMPVDVWNVHNFVGAEYCIENNAETGKDEYTCYGMGVPVGTTIGTDQPSYIRRDNLHVSKETFARQIRDFRAWMKAKGQMNKPLIVTEYGVLYTTLCPQTDGTKKRECIDDYNANYGGYVELQDPDVIHDFMIWTFRYFAGTKDPTLSGVNDGELVQSWAWFSLTENSGCCFNQYGPLYTRDTRTMTDAGRLYRNFALTNWARLQDD